MKKIILLQLFLLLTCMLSAQSEKMSYKEMSKIANSAMSIGVGYTSIGALSDNFKEGGININMTIFGVYFDFDTILSGNHESSVEVKKWENEKKGWAFHLGYQIPITKWLRVIPNLGYIKGSYGKTNGENWTVNSYGIHNEYTSYGKDYETSGIDYGAIVSLHIDKNFNINLNAIRHCPGISAVLEFPFGY